MTSDAERVLAQRQRDLLDRYTPLYWLWWLASRCGPPALLIYIALCVSGWAHDRWGNPNWIANGAFISPIDGSHCCGTADCAVIDRDDVREVAGGLHVRGVVTYGSGPGAVVQAIDETVPHAEVQPSRDGSYWRCKRPNGSRRCFFAPPPSM